MSLVIMLPNMLPFELRKAIYNSFITPHYNYCAETWHFCSKSSLNKLEKVNERAIRFVFKDKNTPYCDLLICGIACQIVSSL